MLRLYSEEDYLRRPEQDLPEILRNNLAQLCLDAKDRKDKPLPINPNEDMHRA